MLGMYVDDTDVIAKHKAMEREMLASINMAAHGAVEIIEAEIKADLASKIVRPNESTGELSGAITGEVVREGKNLVLGVGDMERMDKEVPYWHIQDVGGPIASNVVPGFFCDAAGRPVPFDPERGSGEGSDLTTVRRGMDVFMYVSGANTYMYVHRPIRPKHYFDSGASAALEKVMSFFGKYFRSVFR